MAKREKTTKYIDSPAPSKTKHTGKSTPQAKSHSKTTTVGPGNYLFRMNEAPVLGESSHWFQMMPVIFFTTIIIMIVHLSSYSRPMSDFYFFSSATNDAQSDFFSYYKMIAIIVTASLALILILYKAFSQTLYIKACYAYAPIAAYSLFVLLSYIFSDYKLFALWGWNDRFEGTATLLAYMIMLTYTINLVNSEKNVQWIINFLAGTSTILGLLGITQAMNHDFFRTVFGKKLITPPAFWPNLDSLNFTFTNQIYQTVYNINYVSFYLTLLIPIFGVLFIRSMVLGKQETLNKKIIWGALFTLDVFNLIGSASSGGLMGMAAVVIIALVVLNKRIIQWWKPVAILILLSILVAGISYTRWMPELTTAVKGVTGEQASEEAAVNKIHKLDYIVTSGDAITLGYQGDSIIFTTYPDDPSALSIKDSSGANLTMTDLNQEHPEFRMDDPRFDWIKIKPAQDDNGNHFLVISTDGNDWPFIISKDGTKYLSGAGRLVNLQKVPAVGWENNQQFGSGRGYIWSRTIPMMADTMLLGHGADTYCIYFPHYDYVGKYNSGTFTSNINILVDKPHNMYFDVIIGTGGVSMLILILLWGIYLVQSLLLYLKEKYECYLAFVGAGIFFGICGFLVSGLVNDSNVSVMPMFYGLLGTGLAVNNMLRHKINA